MTYLKILPRVTSIFLKSGLRSGSSSQQFLMSMYSCWHTHPETVHRLFNLTLVETAFLFNPWCSEQITITANILLSVWRLSYLNLSLWCTVKVEIRSEDAQPAWMLDPMDLLWGIRKQAEHKLSCDRKPQASPSCLNVNCVVLTLSDSSSNK